MDDEEKVQHAVTVLAMLGLAWLGWLWSTSKK